MAQHFRVFLSGVSTMGEGRERHPFDRGGIEGALQGEATGGSSRLAGSLCRPDQKIQWTARPDPPRGHENRMEMIFGGS